MMPFGFSAPLAAWLALLALPLVAFYFLKLKRPRVEVPSLVLWQQVLNDSRVNSPFQRFKRNLLLWLQLLLLLLLVVAAMQPYLRSGRGRRMQLPILIDCSASMGAREKAGGPTRLDLARRRAGERIEGMLRGERICLVAFSRRARRVTDFTSNKRELLAALDRITVEEVASDLEDALNMAQALGRATPVEEVLLLSDGNLPAHSAVELPFALTFERMDAAGPNAGITSLRAVRAANNQWRVFVGIDASESYRGPATLEATLNDASLVREVVAPTFDNPERVIFTVAGDAPSRIQVRLAADGIDAMASDNTATLDLPALRPANVYVDEGLAACRRVVSLMEDVELWPGPQGERTPGDVYDTIVSGNIADEEALQAPVRLGVGYLPTALTGTVTRLEGTDRVVDWRRDDALLQHVALGNVVLSAGTRYSGTDGIAACEALGFDVMVHGAQGPLLVRQQSAQASRYTLLVDIEQTTLPYRIALPVMLANLVNLSLEGEGLAKADGVGLLSPAETQLVAVDRIEFAEVAVSAADGPVRGTRPLWPVVVMVAFILLLIEWWFFHRMHALKHREERS